MTEENSALLNLQNFHPSSKNLYLLANTIGDRAQSDTLEEIIHFLSDCKIEILRELSYLEGRWQTDPALWLHLTAASAGRGIMFKVPEAKLRNQTFSAALRAIANECLNTQENNLTTIKEFIFKSLAPLLYYPGISRDEIMDTLNWIASLNINARAGYPYEEFFAHLEKPDDFLAAAKMSAAFGENAVKYNGSKPNAHSTNRWEGWHEFLKENPQLIQPDYVNDPIILEWHWRNNRLSDDAFCEYIIRHFKKLVDAPDNQFETQLKPILKHAEEIFLEYLTKWPYALTPTFATLVYTHDYPLLKPKLFTWALSSSYVSDYIALILQILADTPEAVNTTQPSNLEKIVPEIPRDALITILPVLIGPLSASSSKSLRLAITTALKEIALSNIVNAGWLNIKNKNMRLVCRDILMAHPDTTTAASLLTQLIDSGGLDAASASTAAGYLEGLGILTAPSIKTDIFTISSNDIAGLEAQASQIKRFASTVKHYDTPEILALMRPLSEHAARVVLHLAATCEQALPPLANALLEQVAEEKRAQLAKALVVQWIAGEGDPKLRWALKLIGNTADDRIVDLLAEAVFNWGESRMQRAVVAVAQLGALDTIYALARALEISSSRKVKESVNCAGNEVLYAAAEKRGISVSELLDELTPDFGLSKAIVLELGDTTFEVLLQGDLTLRLKDKQGKVFKSLPINKNPALAETWDAANSQFKTLSAALKNIVKQQAPRMQAAFIIGKTWPSERWQRLFLNHPLLRVMGQGLIWQTQENQPRSFRIAEDFSLLDVEDNIIELPDNTKISLWHPVNVTPAEVNAWKTNLADYELEGMIDQINAPTELPPTELLTANKILALPNLRIAQEQLAGILRKCGYVKGPIGDGPSIEYFEFKMPALQLRAHLTYDDYPPYMTLGKSIHVYAIEIFGRKCVAANLPKALLASLWQHMSLIISKRLP